LLLFGHAGIVPVLAAAEFVSAAGVLVFAVNIFRNVLPSTAQAAKR
jgi:hypothetical protein